MYSADPPRGAGGARSHNSLDNTNDNDNNNNDRSLSLYIYIYTYVCAYTYIYISTHSWYIKCDVTPSPPTKSFPIFD